MNYQNLVCSTYSRQVPQNIGFVALSVIWCIGCMGCTGFLDIGLLHTRTEFGLTKPILAEWQYCDSAFIPFQLTQTKTIHIAVNNVYSHQILGFTKHCCSASCAKSALAKEAKVCWFIFGEVEIGTFNKSN